MSIWIQYSNDPRLPETEEVFNNIAIVQPLGIRVYGKTFKEAQEKAFTRTQEVLDAFQKSLTRLKRDAENMKKFEADHNVTLPAKTG